MGARRWWRPAPAVAAIVTVALGAAACGGSKGSSQRSGTTTEATEASATTAPGVGSKDCLAPSDGATLVRFSPGKGASLAGAVLGGGTKGVVLAHQVDGDACQTLPFARVLARRGYFVLVFDFEARGRSTMAPSGRYGVDRDVAAAVSELRRRGATSVVLVGFSMGATASLAAAQQITPPVDGVVSVSAPASYDELGGHLVDAVAAVRRSQVPVLFAVGRDDRDFDADARTLDAAAAAPEHRLVEDPSSGHGVALVAGEGSAVSAAVLAFLAAHSR